MTHERKFTQLEKLKCFETQHDHLQCQISPFLSFRDFDMKRPPHLVLFETCLVPDLTLVSSASKRTETLTNDFLHNVFSNWVHTKHP